jgi:cytochrome c-type biogenesis protein CcmH/NrfF
MRTTSGLVLGTFKQSDGLPEDLSEGTTNFRACRIAVARSESPSLFAVRCVELHSVTDRLFRSLKQQLRCPKLQQRGIAAGHSWMVVNRVADLYSGGKSELVARCDECVEEFGIRLMVKNSVTALGKAAMLHVTVTAYLCF